VLLTGILDDGLHLGALALTTFVSSEASLGVLEGTLRGIKNVLGIHKFNVEST
jgi:hypothetical protein